MGICGRLRFTCTVIGVTQRVLFWAADSGGEWCTKSVRRALRYRGKLGGGGLDQLSHSLLSLEMLHTGDDGMLPSMARWLSEEVALRVWHVELHVGAAKATLTS